MGVYNIVNAASMAAGQPEDVSVVLANLQAIQAVLNGGIDNSNIGAGAAIAYAKLALGGSIVNADVAAGAAIAPTKIGFGAYPFVNADIAAAAALAVSKLAAGGTDQLLGMLAGVPTWIPNAPARQTTGVDVVTSIAEVSVWTPQVPANALSTNRMAIMILGGDLLHNNVAGDTVTLRFKFGGTTIYSFAASFGAVLSAIRHPWILILCLMELGATNSQFMFGAFLNEDASATAPTTGIGSLGGGRTGPFAGAAPNTIDTTLAQNLDVTAQWSASSANNSFRSRGGVLLIK